eukprot:1649216-Amphidinium_carterae.3
MLSDPKVWTTRSGLHSRCSRAILSPASPRDQNSSALQIIPASPGKNKVLPAQPGIECIFLASPRKKKVRARSSCRNRQHYSV